MRLCLPAEFFQDVHGMHVELALLVFSLILLFSKKRCYMQYCTCHDCRVLLLDGLTTSIWFSLPNLIRPAAHVGAGRKIYTILVLCNYNNNNRGIFREMENYILDGEQRAFPFFNHTTSNIWSMTSTTQLLSRCYLLRPFDCAVTCAKVFHHYHHRMNRLVFLAWKRTFNNIGEVVHYFPVYS